MRAVPTALKKRFIDNYYRFATPDDIPDSRTSREALAVSHLKWGNDRSAGQIKVRVFNAEDGGYGSSNTIVETITDDSPFIVDSLTMRLNALSQGINVKLHTVLDIERDESGLLQNVYEIDGKKRDRSISESWTHFEIPRVIEAAEQREIERQLSATLRDVRIAVQDWKQMLQRLRDAADDIRKHSRNDDAEESAELLDWLADDHFTLLGYCWRSGAEHKKALGLLKDAKRRSALRRKKERAHMGRASLTITKAPIASTVHRPALLDDIGIVAIDQSGKIQGEHRFIGLFTSTAYSENPRDIPLLRSKVARVVEQSGLAPASHRGKALTHILDNFPRDELIQISVAELERIGTGILNIEERRKTRLFVSKSAYGDFYYCLVYLPRDTYSSRTRERIEALLQDSLDGDLVNSQPMISESTLARLAVTIQRADSSSKLPDVNRIEGELAEVAMAWIDRSRLTLLENFPKDRALSLHHRLARSFPVAYQESVRGERIARDFAAVDGLLNQETSKYFDLVARDTNGIFSVFLCDQSVPLYLTNPILENMGVKLLQETSYELIVGEKTIRIQDFTIASAHRESLDSEGLAERFEDCFAKTLQGRVENDNFNCLTVSAGLDWRQIVVLRAYCKFLLQCRSQFSQAYMVETLRRYPDLVQVLCSLFDCYFDPQLSNKDRDQEISRHTTRIRELSNQARNLDDDRILRMFSAAIQATLRTNYFQLEDGLPKPYLSMKLDSARIPDMPEPRPKFEIFVYSPLVEGVHLRCGEISRGGLRWSDRREDFRTEVLGLMKAQQVKNTVIVPAGAKGGFVLKQPPEDRSALQGHVVDCYRTFLRGLLDVTDNIVGKRTISPESTVCRDDPDPYLVVAADKGTATFSDTANSVAEEYDFWLGDAFASGGSAGYDHKKMGITARGAWESVKRHFREIGIDTQTESFTVAGIGDMSGDVFGNGMLLSETIRLVAAFNHKHIFIDPNPDSARSFTERKRLFEMARSGWDDYEQKLISKGGGIYDRQSKSIRLSAEAAKALGVDATELTPPELIQSILKAPVDLLWNGGIGTYIKSSTESDSDAADPASDAVRVDGRSIRAKIIAEGGNLGLTQLGRIEYALAGGRINTDFIDNSAGVDSSDREVNIKILLSDAIRRKALAKGRRNTLLASMTEEVADLVLASNYAQTQAISIMLAKAHERIGEHARLIRTLESKGQLNRTLENLPGEEEIDERVRSGIGFTRPELAVILSYAKIELYDSLVTTDIPDEKQCQAEVFAYFPKRLRTRFKKSILSHRLRREISAMLLSSSMVNRMGPAFSIRAQNDTGGNAADVARAYAIVRELFDTRSIWKEIESLDGQLQAQVQYECFYECGRMLRRAVYWFLHRRSKNRNIEASVTRKRQEVSAVLADLPDVLCGWSKRGFERDTGNFERVGVPRPLAERIASLSLLTQVLDIAATAHDLKIDALTVARLHFELGRGLRLDWIREQIEELKVEGHWSALARSTLRETLGREQRALLLGILKRAKGGDYRLALGEWLTASNTEIIRLKRTLTEMQASGQMDFATLSIALKEIDRLH